MFSRVGVIAVFVLWASAVFAQPARPPADGFAAEGLGFVSPADSTALTSQANAAGAPAIKLRALQPAPKLRGFQTIFNTNAIFANVAIPDADQQKLNARLDGFLKKSGRVTASAMESSQAAVYSAISLRPNPDGSAVLEVLVGVSDWAGAQSHKAEGPVAALVKSTVWIGVARKKIARESLSGGGQFSMEKLEPAVLDLYQTLVGKILATS